jgi:dienelactone hydrolase
MLTSRRVFAASASGPLAALTLLALAVVPPMGTPHVIDLRGFGPPDAVRYFPPASSATPRVARDEVYATAVLRAWGADADVEAANGRGEQLVHEFHSYYDASSSGTLYGEFFYSDDSAAAPDAAADGGASSGPRRPGVVLFHTGAGPRDVFLHWRATSLAAAGFVVFVADMIGDAAGDKWDGASWLASAPPAHNWTLGASAALRELRAHPRTDGSRLAAIGWCAGGLPVFDLLRASPAGLVAVVSFHGDLRRCIGAPFGRTDTRALLAVGNADPFAGRPEDVDACTARLAHAGIRYQLATYGPDVVHAFSNPGQVHAPEGPSFRYDELAAMASWRAARALLCDATGAPADACDSTSRAL